LFFKVLKITHKVNKVSVKYITKNIKTEGREVFLTTINHIRANTISSRNLRLMATRTYKVWLSGSLVCPLKNMISVINDIAEKTVVCIAISLKRITGFKIITSRYPLNNIRKYKNKNRKKYL
jgi:hypothetical protein